MKVRFILNPVSGHKKPDLERLERTIQLNFPQADMCLTKAPGHATQLAQEAAREKYDLVVAIGGDGTINETARGLVHTQTTLGVIPQGSGNGFARELGMSLLFEEAVMYLQRGTVQACDVGYINDELFLNVAGIGIEAEVAARFKEHTARTGERGMWPYFVLGMQTALNYQPSALEIEADGNKMSAAPLTLAFANGRQYGSNFKIAPQASLTDGLLDMVLVQNAPKWKLAIGSIGFFTEKWRPFHLTKTTGIRQAIIHKNGPITYHLDGEVRQTKDTLTVRIDPQALRILLPEGHHAR